MRYVLTGSTGLLGSTFLRRLDGQAMCPTRADLDAAASEALFEQIARFEPRVLINCAAHVQADQAEDDPEPVFEANVKLPERLATVCRRLGIPLVHFSSTGCYGNWKDTPFTERDELRPTTVHHRFKAEGEDAVRRTIDDHVILRTGWLFGGLASHRRNFVWQRLLEANGRETLRSDASQRGCPTLTDDVVSQTHALLDHGQRGTFNCVAGGAASRFEYVAKIIALFDMPCRVEPGAAFSRRAPVSPNETAVNERLQSLGLDLMPDWTEALARYRDEVRSWPEWAHLTAAKGSPQ